MTARLRALLGDAANELDRIKFDVTVADIGALDSSRWQLFFAVRAMAYVRASAVLEAFTKGSLGAILTEVDSQALPHNRLRLSLHAIHEGAFEALASGKLTKWRRRVELLQRVDDAAPVAFGRPTFALDGRTLRPDHFETIWQVFGFAGASLPSPPQRYRLALNDLADRRNDLAHGLVSPIDVARGKPTSEVLRMLSDVLNVAEHLALAAEQYLTGNHFRR